MGFPKLYFSVLKHTGYSAALAVEQLFCGVALTFSRIIVSQQITATMVEKAIDMSIKKTTVKHA